MTEEATVSTLLKAHRLLQFSYGVAQGGFFLGDEEEEDLGVLSYFNQTSSNSTDDIYNDDNGGVYDDDADDDKDPAERILSIFLLLLSGVGVVLGITTGTWIISVLLDKYGCCCPGFGAAFSLEDLDQGPTARRAGLWGLRLAERQEILNHFFEDKVIIYASKKREDATAETKTAQALPVVTEKLKEVAKTADVEKSEGNEADVATKGEETKNANSRKEVDQHESEEAQKEEDEGLDDADHERVCCVCLGEYEDGCELMIGENCVHKLHYDCSMEWLAKHDHCPYCRKGMVSATNFRQAAIEVLGGERVKELGGGCALRVEQVPAAAATSAIATTMVQEGGDREESPKDEVSTEPDLEACEGAAVSEIELITTTKSGDETVIADADALEGAEATTDETDVEVPIKEEEATASD